MATDTLEPKPGPGPEPEPEPESVFSKVRRQVLTLVTLIPFVDARLENLSLFGTLFFVAAVVVSLHYVEAALRRRARTTPPYALLGLIYLRDVVQLLSYSSVGLLVRLVANRLLSRMYGGQAVALDLAPLIVAALAFLFAMIALDFMLMGGSAAKLRRQAMRE